MASQLNVLLYDENWETIKQIQDHLGIRSNAEAIRIALVFWARMNVNGRNQLVALAQAHVRGHITDGEFAQQATLLILS